jgi:hypothetical protein
MSIESVRRPMSSSGWRFAGGLGVVVGLVLFLVGRAAATDVTACQQVVAPRDIGVLQTDLVCPDSAAAVFLGDRATLAIGGHTITGGGVYCPGKCTIIGPGVIQDVQGNGTLAAIAATSSRGRLIVQDVTLTNNGFGILSDAHKNIFTNVDASNNLHDGIWVFGIARGENVTTNDNGDTGFRSEILGVGLTGFTATGNGQSGLINNGTNTRLTDSTLTGNAFGPFPDNPTVLDLFSYRRPRLVNTTCEHSLGPNDVAWGVCSAD